MSDYVNAAATPRTIPWDCSDWQASAAVEDAEDARVSVILESLATNRGKTLYCAVDQSDTFTKAETWQAGKDRNERDDTVYYGANGRFRGFLAAQEGYLTDGESGVTGVSRERIFEFPEEQRRRVTRIKRLRLPADDTRRVYSAWGDQTNVFSSAGRGDPNSETFSGAYGQARMRWTNRPAGQNVDWAALTRAAAETECAARGYPRVGRITVVDPGLAGSGQQGHWDYRDPRNNPTSNFQYQARQFRWYVATCEKRVRKTVRSR